MRWLMVCGVILLFGTIMSEVQGDQRDIPLQGPSATPAQVDLFDVVPTQVPFEVESTPTRTPTPLGIAQLEALQAANVRAAPDPEAELLGQIRPGEYYNVIRRYYRWIEFQYDQTETRRGWVFDELVTIIGDESVIPSVESLDESVSAVDDFNATATALGITQTPGALLTATAQARPGTGSGALQSEFSIDQITQEVLVDEVLPTFTYPPGIIAAAPTESASTATAENSTSLSFSAPGSLPPVVPIALLGALGLIGLLVSYFRE